MNEEELKDAFVWLVSATRSELELMFKLDQGKDRLTLDEYAAWWDSRKDRIDDFIVNEKTRVGVLHITNTDTEEPEMGFHIDIPDDDGLWQKIAKVAIECGIIRATSSVKGIKRLRAFPNDKEVELFESFGFKKEGKGKKQVWVIDVEERKPTPPGSVKFSW